MTESCREHETVILVDFRHGLIGLQHFYALLALNASGWGYGQVSEPPDPLYLTATTVCLGVIVLLQIVNVFLCRNPIRSLASTGLLGNWPILWGVVAEIGAIGLIAYAPLGNDFFSTASLPPSVWLALLPAAGILLVLEEGRKWSARRMGDG